MSVLVNGMEMPKEGFVEIIIRDDGTVQQTGQSYRIDGTDYYTPYVGEVPIMSTAVPVPPHGRLIDADELCNKLDRCMFPSMVTTVAVSIARNWILESTTIIPATEEET